MATSPRALMSTLKPFNQTDSAAAPPSSGIGLCTHFFQQSNSVLSRGLGQKQPMHARDAVRSTEHHALPVEVVDMVGEEAGDVGVAAEREEVGAPRRQQVGWNEHLVRSHCHREALAGVRIRPELVQDRAEHDGEVQVGVRELIHHVLEAVPHARPARCAEDADDAAVQ
eukprot:UN2635